MAGELEEAKGTGRKRRSGDGDGGPKWNLFTIPELRALLILSPLTKLGWEPTVL